MEVKGYRTDILRIPCGMTDITDCIFIDLINSHIETDIVRRGSCDIFHDCIICITTDSIMAFTISVKAKKYQISFGKVDRKRAICNNVNDQKAHCLGLFDKIPESSVTVSPHKGLSSAEKEDPDSHVKKLLHFTLNLLIRMDDGGDIINRTMFAVQIAFICHNNCSEDRILLAKQDRFYSESRKMQE